MIVEKRKKSYWYNYINSNSNYWGVSYLLINNHEGNIKTVIKSSLDKIVEKSDLETANVTYNVIAKKMQKNYIKLIL